ncbi:MAG: GyrI-like domain-containing protein [Verrucomicrobia bacterium]|nr:GyrI-like domain-containing protein [Verrucomicrobiota bacterium]
MSELQVRVERLAPMRVARFRAFGRSPEPEAWARLRTWAEPCGLLKDNAAHPVFGFNNPSPSPGLEEYGYEFWIRIAPEAQVERGIETLDYPGGWHAVTTQHGFPNPDVWMQLLEWVRRSPHRHRRTHELERPHNPLAAEAEMVFDLYLPVEKPASALAGPATGGTS